MTTNVLSWFNTAQRFSLMILLAGVLVVQAMQMVSPSHVAMNHDMASSEHMTHGDHGDAAQSTPLHDDHTGACQMMACQALSPLAVVIPVSAMVLIAQDKATLDVAMIDGPFLSQLGKPPKHI